jgi:hypothetical protein
MENVRNVPDVTISVGEHDQSVVFESASVTFSAYHEPSRFDVRIPLTEALQRDLIRARSPRVTIRVNDKPFFLGLADEANGEVDDETGERALRISGQDLSRLLFRTPITESIKSMTASEWVKARAKAHGLKFKVDDVQQQIGAQVAANNSSLSNQQKESDLLADLSAWNNKVSFVDHDTLYWVEAPRAALNKSWHLGKDFNAFSWRKSFEAEQTKVEVSSWNPRLKKGQKQVKATAGQGNILLRINRPGLTVQQAERLAKSRQNQAELAALSVSLRDLPGDLSLPRLAWTFTLYSVGLGASQTFFPTSVTHAFTPDSHLMSVEGTNLVEAQT